MFKVFKKLAMILATSISMTKACEKAYPSLLFKCVLCIYHLVRFKKNQAKVRALLDSNSELNIIIIAYIAEVGLNV